MRLFVPRAPVALFLIIFSALFATAPAYSQAAGSFRLIGTIEGGSGFTGAVLDDNSGTQTFYRLREPLPDGSSITKVASDNISIKRSDGTSYTLFLVQNAKPGAPEPARAASNPAVGAPGAAPAIEPPLPPEPQPNRMRAQPAPGRRESGNANGAAGSRMSRKQHRAQGSGEE